MALLEISGLHAGYSAADVLRGVAFTVEQDGITTVLGANGAGKTTLLRAVSGMVRRQGSMRFDGRPIENLATEDYCPPGNRARARWPRHFLRFHHRGKPAHRRLHPQGPACGDRADFERVFNYFPRLKERRHQQAGTLSGGEQQMLAIARALMLSPRLLLLDEPSFGLAPLVVQDIFRIMRSINAEEGVSVLLVEQNAALALDLADHAYVLETGQVVMSGSADSVRSNETVRRAYLGY